jgi:hypothetical protein
VLGTFRNDETCYLPRPSLLVTGLLVGTWIQEIVTRSVRPKAFPRPSSLAPRHWFVGRGERVRRNRLSSGQTQFGERRDGWKSARPQTKHPLTAGAKIRNWSGREDLNLRPLQPHCSALPDCATPRKSIGRMRDEKAGYLTSARDGMECCESYRASSRATSSSSNRNSRIICREWRGSSL